jgi:hypothetical protein
MGDSGVAPAEFWQPSEGNFWFYPSGDSYLCIRGSVHPGDVLLFATGRKVVELAQKRWHHRFRDWEKLSPQPVVYIDDAWRWTHAAIYIDADHLICEAVRSGGVRVGSLEDRLWRRRPQAVQVMRHLSADENRGKQIARIAANYRGLKYKNLDCLLYGLKGKMQDDENPERLICSTLCARSLAMAGAAMPKPEDAPMTPSYLRQCRMLRAIDTVLLPVRRS